MSQAFKVVSKYQPAGDQPAAIKKLNEGVQAGLASQILLGVTGSGKTFTIANLVAQLQRPTIVMAHNKTLAAQLYGEFKEFLPHICFLLRLLSARSLCGGFGYVYRKRCLDKRTY